MYEAEKLKKIKKRGYIMNFLNVDFANGTTALFKEAFKFKKYKAMPVFFAVVVGIFQIPFALISFLMAGLLYIFNFMIKLFKIPVEEMHKIVRSEKEEVKHATQAVVYLISWPLIFFSYAMLVSFNVVLNIFYLIVSVTTFVWSLGGFRFHLLMSDVENIEKDVEGKYNKKVLIWFLIGIVAVLILLPIILSAIYYIGLSKPDKDYVFKLLSFADLMKHFAGTFKGKFIIALPVLFGFSFIYTLIAFVPYPKASKAVEATETVVEETTEETTEEVTEEVTEEATEEVTEEVTETVE